MMEELSMETLDLLAELDDKRKNAKTIALLARRMDYPKRKIEKMIAKAREELEDSDILIMHNGHGGYYTQKRVDNDDDERQSLLSMFG